MKKILYLTDLYYNAKGRNYYEEDLYITNRLKEHYDLALCHPKNSISFENDVDLIIFRNTGSVLGFEKIYKDFCKRIEKNNIKTFNQFTGKADMCGKQYLIDLFTQNYPIIPTIDDIKELDKLPSVDRYVIKPKDGADSIGLEFLNREELFEKQLTDMIIQPAIDFEYEVSFYFINDQFEYAMYAPNIDERWNLKMYDCSIDEINFAKQFIEWNDINWGIQRVDACKTKEGDLLLMELEDLNPYLSLLELDDETRDKFINDLTKAIDDII